MDELDTIQTAGYGNWPGIREMPDAEVYRELSKCLRQFYYGEHRPILELHYWNRACDMQSELIRRGLWVPSLLTFKE